VHDASLKDDFEFYGHVAEIQERTYAVTIGPNVSRNVDGLTKNRAERPVRGPRYSGIDHAAAESCLLAVSSVIGRDSESNVVPQAMHRDHAP
jgi:hypothetical protein